MADEKKKIDMESVYACMLITANTRPVHLSQEMSIDMSKVIRYGAFELFETVTEKVAGSKSETVEVQKASGKFAPGVVMVDGDVITFTDKQNRVFRDRWNAYALLTDYLYTAALTITEPLRKAIDAAAKADAEKKGGES